MFQLIFTSILVFSQLVAANEVEINTETVGFQILNGVYEPSGIIQLQDGRLLIIEDESSRAFVLLTPNQYPANYNVDIVQTRSLLDRLLAGSSAEFNDLEGIVKGPQEFVYAISSHSRQGNGRRDSQREQLVRFTIHDNRIGKLSARGGLRDALVSNFPMLQQAADEREVKKNAGLNIEGLAFNRSGDTLWLGFRAPLVGDHAILIGLHNLHKVFESDAEFEFGENAQLLNLDGGGIRDIVFDTELDGYLIVSQRERTKNEKPFKLWLWSGSAKDSPRRIRIKGVKNIRQTEGVVPITIGHEKRLLLVSDEGDKKHQKNAKVLMVDYDELQLE